MNIIWTCLICVFKVTLFLQISRTILDAIEYNERSAIVKDIPFKS